MHSVVGPWKPSSLTATSKRTVSISPGARDTCWNPFSSFTGRVTLPTRSCTYSCTVSVPSRSPVLLTTAETTRESPAPT